MLLTLIISGTGEQLSQHIPGFVPLVYGEAHQTFCTQDSCNRDIVSITGFIMIRITNIENSDLDWRHW